MVAGVLLTLHVIAAGYAFLKYKKESVKEGLVAVAFVAIIFSVGWTLATTLTNLLLSIPFLKELFDTQPESALQNLLKKELNRDTLSLVFLTAGESVFYYFFLRRNKNKALRQKEKSLKEEKK